MVTSPWTGIRNSTRMSWCFGRRRFWNPSGQAYRRPGRNGIAERWVGSCRREMLDQVIALNEQSLRRLVRDYVNYYHEDRIHDSLGKDTPNKRPVEQKPAANATVISCPRLGACSIATDGAKRRRATTSYDSVIAVRRSPKARTRLQVLPRRAIPGALRLTLLRTISLRVCGTSRSPPASGDAVLPSHPNHRYLAPTALRIGTSEKNPCEGSLRHDRYRFRRDQHNVEPIPRATLRPKRPRFSPFWTIVTSHRAR
jgi:hypothetical protein